MAEKRKEPEVFQPCKFHNMSHINLVFNSILCQMITQYCKLRNVRFEEKGRKWLSSVAPNFYNNPVDYRKLVVILQAVLRAEMEEIVAVGSRQIAILVRRSKTLLSYLPQFKEDAILNIDLWLMKKFSSAWCLASTM